jgi:hypothetical protein
MKEVLGVLTFSIAALSFVIFLTVIKPDDLSVTEGASSAAHCKTELSTLDVCRPRLPGETGAGTPFN